MWVRELNMIYVKVHPLTYLSQIAEPETANFEGNMGKQVGHKTRGGGLQGHYAFLSDDGKFMFEGFFKDGQKNGVQRTIKVSKRKPGHFTVHET